MFGKTSKKKSNIIGIFFDIAFRTDMLDSYICHLWNNLLVFSGLPFHKFLCRSRSSGMGTTDSFESLPSQRGCSYKVRTEDIGFTIRCECIVVDAFDRLSSPVTVVSAAIAPGKSIETLSRAVVVFII